MAGGSEIWKVKDDVFTEMAPDRIIFLLADTDIIKQTLRQRDIADYSVEFINEFQNSEMVQARHIANLLSIPMSTLYTSGVKPEGRESTLLKGWVS